MNKYEQAAARFCGAIREIAKKPDNLDNLECYLSYHFATWLEKRANTPDAIADELREFATMKI